MTNATITTSTNKHASARVLYVLSVASFPILMAGLISLSAFAFGFVAMDDGIEHTNEFARFDFPTPGITVPEHFETRGRLKAIPAGKTVYLVERSGDKFWPKEELGTTPTDFSRKQYASAGAGYKYTIELLAVGEVGHAEISEWFRKSKASGKYHGMQMSQDMELLTKIRVIRK